MRLSLFFIAALMLFGQAGTAKAQSADDLINDFESGFTIIADFDTIYDFVLPSDEDTRWRQVPWIPSLWEGMQVAKKTNKPMFIWAMNGDPLGCV